MIKEVLAGQSGEAKKEERSTGENAPRSAVRPR
jgi:hypothetical protein